MDSKKETEQLLDIVMFPLTVIAALFFIVVSWCAFAFKAWAILALFGFMSSVALFAVARAFKKAKAAWREEL